MTKRCSKCKIDKEYSKYYKLKSSKTGIQSVCKICTKEYQTLNKEKIKECKAKYDFENEERLKEYSRQYRIIKKVEIKKRNKIYKSKNRETIREKGRVYAKQYRKDNLSKIREAENRRRNSDPLYKLICNLRTRIYSIIRGKSKKTKELLGCSLEELKNHLSENFLERYRISFSWESYVENGQNNGWHIDHIIPLSSAKTEEELYILCHYSNLQILWCKENLKKGISI